MCVPIFHYYVCNAVCHWFFVNVVNILWRWNHKPLVNLLSVLYLEYLPTTISPLFEIFSVLFNFCNKKKCNIENLPTTELQLLLPLDTEQIWGKSCVPAVKERLSPFRVPRKWDPLKICCISIAAYLNSVGDGANVYNSKMAWMNKLIFFGNCIGSIKWIRTLSSLHNVIFIATISPHTSLLVTCNQ